MLEILDVEQGSEWWHELRGKYYRSASRTPIVCDVSPFQTKEQLAMQLRGEYTPYYNKAMQLGNELEDDIRDMVNDRLGDIFLPKVGVNDNYLASLDGINFDMDTIIEIKCSEKTTENLKYGVIDKNYFYQIQHQLKVFDCAKVAYLCAYNPKTMELIISEPIYPNKEIFEEIEKAWDNFVAAKDTLTVTNFDLSENIEFRDAVEEYKYYKIQIDNLTELLNQSKDKLLSFYGGAKTFGGGLNITYAKESKQINYGQIYKENKELFKDIDLEKYTTIKQGSFRITLEKGE